MRTNGRRVAGVSPAFVSVVGGLAVFGASGVILGPLAVTITLALLEISRV